MTPQLLVLIVFAPVVAAFSQVLLKVGALRFGGSAWWRQYVNVPVVSAYALFFGVTVINIYLFSRLPLSIGNVLIAIVHVLVAVSGRLFFHERLSRRQMRGIALTVVGMVLYSIGM